MTTARSRAIGLAAALMLVVPGVTASVGIRGASGATKVTKAVSSANSVTTSGMRFTFPSKPTKQSTSTSTEVGKVTIDTWSINDFSLAIASSPVPVITSKNVDAVLDGSATGAANNVKGKLRSTSKEKFLGRDSIAIVIDVGAATVFQRVIADTKTSTLVQVIAVSGTAKATKAPADFVALLASAKNG